MSVMLVYCCFMSTYILVRGLEFDALCKWACTWQLLFNFSKYTILTVGHLNYLNNYLMESFHIENVECAKDFSMTIDIAI